MHADENRVQAFQKDAIYRQMQEYKREKNILESQIKEVQKRSVDHDDHLRVIDAWWSQVSTLIFVTRIITDSLKAIRRSCITIKKHSTKSVII
jgi:hypothetical protein